MTPEYFKVLGLRLIDGRLLDEQDVQAQDFPRVIVDRAWQRRFFPNESAVGKRFKSGGCTNCAWTTVVGVVSEVKYAGLEQPDQGTVYTVYTGGTFGYLIIRAKADASARSRYLRRLCCGWSNRPRRQVSLSILPASRGQ